MNIMNIEYTPDSIVHASNFVLKDGGALFGALKDIGGTVGLVIIEDPQNPLLRRHAEQLADRFDATVDDLRKNNIPSLFSMRMMELGEQPGCRENNIERELNNIQNLMKRAEFGAFAIFGAQEDVSTFMESYLCQPESV